MPSSRVTGLDQATIASKVLRMHHFDPILQKIPQGRPPDPSQWEGAYPPSPSLSPHSPLGHALEATPEPDPGYTPEVDCTDRGQYG